MPKNGGDVAQVRPFRSSFPQADLEDLRRRLESTRLAPALSGAEWTHGTPPGYLAELVEYWRDSFDWAAAERRLNEMPQFQAEVDDCTLHFVHQKGTGPSPFPLLFTHGWPGSFWEVHKILGPLTDPGAHGGDPADAFDVIAPSLPGYGFSPHPGRPGLGPSAIAGLLDRLVTDVLGYPRYGAQGGDWGAIVTACLGRDHTGKLAGIHVNMIASQPVLGEDSAPLSEAEQESRAKRTSWQAAEGGYGHIQGTKPSTLAAGLSDSPAGLAAWIVEKFRTWSDCGGDVESVFSKDELLTNITLYWLTNTIGTSARLYYEAQRDKASPFAQPSYITTPTAFARFPREISTPPREWVERGHNLVHYTEFAEGGHFPALEQPEALVEDIRSFFRPLRG
jgi:pimeloyl-ACP methyl ester carboxylesterase